MLNESHKDIIRFRDYMKDVTPAGVHTGKDQWNPTIISLMAEHGFTLLGQGKYATVFNNPTSSYVIKVFLKDTAYLTWLKFCFENPRNPFVPQIRGKVVKLTPIFMAVRLEKLLPYKYTDQHPNDFNIWGEQPPCQCAHCNNPDVQNVQKFLDQHSKLLDIHPGNVMQRSNGHIVIIDPFYNWFDRSTMTNKINPDDISGFSNLF